MLPKRKIQQINKNVWKVEENGETFSVKRYDSPAIAYKVKMVHKLLTSISFPHICQVVSQENQLLFKQPWLNYSTVVDFSKQKDRIDSLAALNALHQTANQVEWSAVTCLQEYKLLKKWEDRLLRFSNLKEKCKLYLKEEQINKLLFYSTTALTTIQRNYNNDDARAMTLLHGDVVHHNILRDKNQIIRFIDFDLACLGPANTEIVLWIHRVLPHINYNIDSLIKEQPSLKSLDQSAMSLLLYPNEVLREWLYFFSLPEAIQQRQLPTLIQFTESALSHWPKLWYTIERMN